MQPMQPLTRQESRPSIYSWWSDSNPGLHGPTINLHTATKPLLRYLHHRQALDLLAKNRYSPLSDAVLEVYSSFFPSNLIAFSTKAAIVAELAARSLSDETDARAVAGSPILLDIKSMLECCDARMEQSCCRLLGNLANHRGTAPDVLKLKPCLQLVFLLRGGKSKVVALAMYALSAIARYEDGAEAIVEAKALDHALELLTSSDALTQGWTCELLASLAGQESTALAVLAISPWGPLMALLCDGDASTIQPAQLALSKVAELLDSQARPVGDPRAIDYLLELFKSEDRESLMRTCKLVGQLARDQCTVPILLDLRMCERLVALLYDDNPNVVIWAMAMLDQIARWVDGAEAVVDAGFTTHVSNLPDLPSQIVGLSTWSIIARYKTTAMLTSTVKKFFLLVALGDDEGLVLPLCRMTESTGGARAIVDTNGVRQMLRLLDSPIPFLRKHTCLLIATLAVCESTASAVSDLKLCMGLVSLFDIDEHGLQRDAAWAMYTLYHIASRPDGAQAVVKANATRHILRFLRSTSTTVRKYTCQLVGKLALHESTAMELLDLGAHVSLVSLLRDDDGGSQVVDQVMSGLSEWADGVAVIC
ncbi:armadillo-type protein [Favolaschia claudopus]|uniref:Armadillo-type protein n=1 Tax=Favolaschia claudopus TaxID=2862362 RepID=A0AAW0BY97_9AGAR